MDPKELAHYAAVQAALEAARDAGGVEDRLKTYETVYEGVFKVVRDTLTSLSRD